MSYLSGWDILAFLCLIFFKIFLYSVSYVISLWICLEDDAIVYLFLDKSGIKVTSTSATATI